MLARARSDWQQLFAPHARPNPELEYCCGDLPLLDLRWNTSVLGKQDGIASAVQLRGLW